MSDWLELGFAAPIAPSNPLRIQVLRAGYCCSGSSPHGDQCAGGQLDFFHALSRLIDASSRSMDADPIALADLSLTELTRHIEAHHHAYIQEALPRLKRMAELVAMLHGVSDSRLSRITVYLDSLASDLLSQIGKEEKTLFPLIRRLDRGGDSSSFLCASVIAPIQRRQLDHVEVSDLVKQLQGLTDNYCCPEWGCNTYRALLDGLQQLEANILAYMEKEQHFLFPRAMELELQRLPHHPLPPDPSY